MPTQEKIIDITMLNYYNSLLQTRVASKAEFDVVSDRVNDLIAEGGEPNVIEIVKVNGTALTPDANKAVNVAVPTETSQLTNDGDGTSNYATEDYVDANGGKIDVIKVNGTAQTITNKEVNLTVPTKASDLTNDSGYQNATEVQDLIDASLADITGIDFQVVDELPTPAGEHGVIYLLHVGGSGTDIYDEYIWLTPTGQQAHYEKIGTTDIDLSGYWDKATYVIATTADIDAIFA